MTLPASAVSDVREALIWQADRIGTVGVGRAARRAQLLRIATQLGPERSGIKKRAGGGRPR